MSITHEYMENQAFDSSDPKAVKAKIKVSKDRETILKDALRTIIATEPGRMWMHELLTRCHPFRSSFSQDALIMANNCGETNIGLQVIADLHACSPDLYLQMMKENSNG